MKTTDRAIPLMENNPYAPSASSLKGALEVPRAETDEESGFRDLGRLGTIVSRLLLLGVVLSILGICSSFMQLKLLSHAPYSMADANANDRREQLINIVHLLVYIATGIVFGRWIYLAHRNLLARSSNYYSSDSSVES